MRFTRPGRPPCFGARSREAISGVTVSETTSEAITARLTVAAKALNTRPTTPPISRIGRNTAISHRVMESTAKPTSRGPLMAAATGSIPASTWRMIASSTTMASSTTRPTAMVSASSVT